MQNHQGNLRRYRAKSLCILLKARNYHIGGGCGYPAAPVAKRCGQIFVKVGGRNIGRSPFKFYHSYSIGGSEIKRFLGVVFLYIGNNGKGAVCGRAAFVNWSLPNLNGY